jgi:hypothetical protein
MARRDIGPPRHRIEPAQYRIDFAVSLAETAALDGGKHVALEQHAFGPLRREHGGIVFWQTHEMLTPPLQCADDRQSSDRDRPVRAR